MGGEEEEERSSPLSEASFSEIMGDMLAGRPALPRYLLLLCKAHSGLRGPPALDSETELTRKLWLNRVFLILLS